MKFLSAIKVTGAMIADLYSRQACPWEKFNRPFLPKTLRTLKEREAECWGDLQGFWFFNEILAHRIPQDQVPPVLDMGDQATWQGIYVATLCFKYARAKSDSLAQLIAHALNGMYQHQWFHGEGKSRLIRGYDRGANNAWEDDASNDTLTGHFFGLYSVLQFGPMELKGKALQLLNGIATELIENNCCLIKADKTPTSYGKLINGALTEPLQMTLALAILTVADHYGLHGHAAKMRDEVYTKYGTMIPYPKMVLGQWENWNDDHRAAIHLAVLAMEDKSPRMQELVRKGLVRLWSLLRTRANIWVNALIMLGLGEAAPKGMQAEMTIHANMILSEYELEDKRWDTETDWRGKLDVKKNLWSGKEIVPFLADGLLPWTPRIITVNGHQRATQPLPLWANGKQDFVWQRHRYSVCDWMGQNQPSQKFNGADFLAAYHLSILTEILSSAD